MTDREALKRPDPHGREEGTWAERAHRTIAAVHTKLAPSATLAERISAVDAAYPFIQRAHHPYHVWCRVRRNYLAKYGYATQQKAKGQPRKSAEGTPK